ncbi:MAG: Mur ligase family protein, partial [Candidatus Omnitrophica bacterium]|nr:Mur ligase family protein [Candidatus Omnitrophota bacterium]
LGGEVKTFSGNAKVGSGPLIIAEVDESDGHFRYLHSKCAVVTNIEREHLEHYGTMENVLKAYKEFISKISPGGFLVVNGEDSVLRDVAKDAPVKKITFGLNGDFDVTCKNFGFERGINFELVFRGRNLGKVSSPLIGRYNLMNILAAMAVCMEAGFDLRAVVDAVKTFTGAKRRFELVDRIGSIEIREDYAHHPTELSSVIKAAKDYSSGRIVSIFQPHRYSRTKDLMSEFSKCFYSSDVLILTGVYSANEDVIEKVGTAGIYDLIDKARFEGVYMVEKERIPEMVAGIVKDNDTILLLGAGDIREISGELVKKIREKRA